MAIDSIEHVVSLIQRLGENTEPLVGLYCVDDALSYIDHNEHGLAFETLLSHILESLFCKNGNISDEAFNMMKMINEYYKDPDCAALISKIRHYLKQA